MKTFILAVLFFICFPPFTFCTRTELYVNNQTSYTVYFQYYPVSAVFNGFEDSYDLTARYPSTTPRYDYICGTYSENNIVKTYYVMDGAHPEVELNIDVGFGSTTMGSFGYGLYKFVAIIPYTGEVLSCIVDFDFRTAHGDNSLYITGTSTGFQLVWGQLDYGNVYIEYNDQLIKPWELMGFSRNAGSFKMNNSNTGSYYNTFPSDPRMDCDVLPSTPNENHDFPFYKTTDFYDPEPYTVTNYDDKQGTLSLSMTMEKNVSSPTEIWSKTYQTNINPPAYYTYTSNPSNVQIEPGVFLAIQSGGALSQNNPISYTLNKITTPSSVNDGTDIIAKATAGSTAGGKLKLLSSTDAAKNSNLVVKDKCNVIIESGATLRVEQYGKIKLESGSTMELKEGAVTEMLAGARIDMTGGTLKVGKNVQLVFEGSGSFLTASTGSQIILDDNASIKFKNGAYINANSVTFNSTSSGVKWAGIQLDSSGSETSITNCTFTNAQNPIRIINKTSGTAARLKVITNNTFNSPSTGGDIIYAENAYNMLIQDNTFNIASGKIGLYIRNSVSPAGSESAGPPATGLNIIHNTFNGGNASLVAAGYASGLVNYYIYNNDFYTSTGYNIIGRKITGDIKGNRMHTLTTDRSVFLHQASSNLLSNTIKGKNALYLIEGNPHLNTVIFTDSPIPQMVWTGGLNELTANTSDVISFQSANLQLNYGRNTLIKNSSSKDHLYGSVISSITNLPVYENCFNGTPGPSHFLWNAADPNTAVGVLFNANYSCTGIGTIADYVVTDKGNGIYDTAAVTSSIYSTPPDEDDALHSHGVLSMDSGRYFTAVTYFKSLLDNHVSSDRNLEAVGKLYECYQALDTFSVQSGRNILWGNLKTYLEGIISSGLYIPKVEETAFDITLMCDVNMESYEDAVTGFEFISLYHPTPETRLMASYDLAAVEDLMEYGSGGAMQSSQQYLAKLTKKIERIVSGDPVMTKVKSSYEKQSDERKKTYIDNIKKGSKADVKLQQQSEKDNMLTERTRANLTALKHMSPEEREKRMTDDLYLIGGAVITEDNASGTVTAVNYSLSQNYPNPFNPSTTISYSLPNEGLAKIKIFDITGREVMTLVNEFKTSGTYQAVFNGGMLSSGVYFYRLEAGTFTETRRMMLVK